MSCRGVFANCEEYGVANCSLEKCCKREEDRLKVKLQADQPVIPVPVYQDVLRRDKYIEVPRVEVKDTFIPRLYTQDAIHDVPKMDVSYIDKKIDIETHKYVDKFVDVPVNMGYAPTFKPKWDVRQVPRIVPKYYGHQQIIELEVPRIEYVDKKVEKEVVVDVQDKIVPKVTEVEKEVEVIQYEWSEKYKDIPIYKYVPKFDVELECPPPLIVPYPETKYVKEPPIYSKTPWAPMPGTLAEGAAVSQGPVQIPADADYTKYFKDSYTKDFVLSADQGVEAEGGMAYPLLTPMPSPQAALKGTAHTYTATLSSIESKKEKAKKWWFWPFSRDTPVAGSEKKEIEEVTYDSETGYPTNMPKDFASFFKRGLSDIRKQLTSRQKEEDITEEISSTAPPAAPPAGCDLEPTVEYKGAVNKPPEYGGALEPISFKLHAIEVHQFIPLPNIETPQFVRMLPSSAGTAPKDNIEKLFGPVSSGWADPSITGMPAPMMNDILQGNLLPNSPLFQQISAVAAEEHTEPTEEQYKKSTSVATVIKEAQLAEQEHCI